MWALCRSPASGRGSPGSTDPPLVPYSRSLSTGGTTSRRSTPNGPHPASRCAIPDSLRVYAVNSSIGEPGHNVQPEQHQIEFTAPRFELPVGNPGRRIVAKHDLAAFRCMPVAAEDPTFHQREPLLGRPLAVERVGGGPGPPVRSLVARLPPSRSALAYSPESTVASLVGHQRTPGSRTASTVWAATYSAMALSGIRT